MLAVSQLLLWTNGSVFLTLPSCPVSPSFLLLVMATNTLFHLAPQPLLNLCLPPRMSHYFSLSKSYLILEAQLNSNFLLEYSPYILELSGPLRNPTAIASQWLMKSSTKHPGLNPRSILQEAWSWASSLKSLKSKCPPLCNENNNIAVAPSLLRIQWENT